ncbi:hypothetical protein BO71DRAFT_430494 [Aspergillus ellipticus CBS 707.79]|uniref:Uncharacterized protein n=1 Tax=Aspergillus ellipticus CBS 707.79 TaxID=1448320 RepID=A0A319DIS2_9EURO|nr:hypothetical protein BO71DRAFT_430494 [Aspergillus ellipticus CBS 707.79]
MANTAQPSNAGFAIGSGNCQFATATWTKQDPHPAINHLAVEWSKRKALKAKRPELLQPRHLDGDACGGQSTRSAQANGMENPVPVAGLDAVPDWTLGNAAPEIGVPAVGGRRKPHVWAIGSTAVIQQDMMILVVGKRGASPSHQPDWAEAVSASWYLEDRISSKR